jgi:valyl-tRNA synthetase
MKEALPTRYEATAVEARWSQAWEAAGSFRPEARPKENDPYVIVIPPPNVTGVLHMGHALNNTLQDVLVRFQRMLGKRALWVPGTDHAGIATQNVVEKALAKDGKRREDLGREAFLERTWAWKEQYGGRIIEQLKRLGCSCDWSRLRFTMDDGLSAAVTTAFVKLFEKDLIYRGERLINWCSRCLTALSDEEAEAQSESGRFYHLRYPVADENDLSLVVATTRPETMLGDTAVAVHPDDERYRHLIGRFVLLPLTSRRIPIIADQHADPLKGSGAVKITPAHDFNDFQVGERHALPAISILNEDGTMSEAAGVYAGLDRFLARKRIVKDLDAQGLLHSVEDKDIPLPRCYRCDTVVEPRLSKQWFVRMRPLLEPAAQAAHDGSLKILPERYRKTYLDWVEQYRDWCISRQIWWGHRIPVWYDADDTPVASSEPLALGSPHPRTGKPIVRQDPDVLDTWFSSQLWPFSVMGWPAATKDLEDYYPTDVLVTARDIIYFWVARMVMCGLEFMGKLPFHTVYINGTVLDELGRRMSKSLGNGIDPLEMGDKYGMDAVRFTLVSLTTEGQDIRLAENRFESGRNFVNKLWNASRFVLLNLEGYDPARPVTVTAPEDRWVLSGLTRLVTEVTEGLKSYKFHEVVQKLYGFTWNITCDWYVELVKGRLLDTSPEAADSRSAAQKVLTQVLDTLLRLLHPIVPHVTEEIRSHLRPYLASGADMLICEDWPVPDVSAKDPEAERLVERLLSLVRAARVIRDRMGIPWSKNLSFVVRPSNADVMKSLLAVRERAMAMGRLEELHVALDAVKPPQSAVVVEDECEIFVPLAGLINLEVERERLAKELAEVRGFIAGIEAKLQNASFVAKAPPIVVTKERARLEELQGRLDKLLRNQADFA